MPYFDISSNGSFTITKKLRTHLKNTKLTATSLYVTIKIESRSN